MNLAIHRITTWKPLPRNVQVLHAIIESMADGNQGRTLWCAPSETMLAIQTEGGLNLSKLQTIASCETTTTRYPSTGQHVYATLIASPTKRDSSTRKLSRLTTEETIAWAKRKLANAIDIREMATDMLSDATGHKNGYKITQTRCGYYIHGIVTDEKALSAHMRDGIGRGKAYGAGLLLVSPA